MTDRVDLPSRRHADTLLTIVHAGMPWEIKIIIPYSIRILFSFLFHFASALPQMPHCLTRLRRKKKNNNNNPSLA
jgi:hypothetical protein